MIFLKPSFSLYVCKVLMLHSTPLHLRWLTFLCFHDIPVRKEKGCFYEMSQIFINKYLLNMLLYLYNIENIISSKKNVINRHNKDHGTKKRMVVICWASWITNNVDFEGFIKVSFMTAFAFFIFIVRTI